MDVKLNQSVMLKLSKLEANKGQIDGLPKNPRIIKDEKFKKLVKSIEDNPEMTSLREILVYPHGDKYVVIGGNMRLKAMKELGYKEAPCKIIPEETTVEQLKAYTIKDNSGFGEWDFDMLTSEWDLQLLSDCAVDIPQIEDESPLIDDKEAVEDDFDEETDKVEWICKTGDIWKLGEHRLMCGDSTDVGSVALLMDGNKADMVFTDPPFGNDLGYGRGQLGERRIKNDEDTKVLINCFNPINQYLKSNTHCLVWIQWRTFSILESAFKKFKLRTVVIWDKKQAGLSGGGFAEQYEMLCVFLKGKATQNEYSGNVWQCARENSKRSESEHPHKKPIEILSKGLNLCSKKNDLVLDCFGGSGSVLIACELNNRRCNTMELDPHYCDVIIARWEKLTGKKAEKIK